MRIGVVSDTHNRVLPSLLDALAGVAEIFHAGDVCREDVLAELESVAPVVAVHGNCDEWALVHRLPAERRIEREGVSIALVHGHQAGHANLERMIRLFTPGRPRSLLAAGQPPPDLVLYGHTHAGLDAVHGATRFFNPGTAGGLRAAPTIGILTIADGGFDLRHVVLSREPPQRWQRGQK